MASLWTNKGVFLVMSSALDLDTTSGIKAVLVKSSFTPNQDDNFMSDIGAAECDVAGYTGGFNGAGRKAWASRTVTEDDTNNRAVFDAADPSPWTLAAGNTLRHVATIQEVTNDADSPILFYNIMDADKITNGGDLTVQVDAAGLARITT